jgi:hypothetical protein
MNPWLKTKVGNLQYIKSLFLFLGPSTITIKEVLSLQLKKIFRKGCQVFTTHMEEAPKDKVPNIEDNAVLK